MFTKEVQELAKPLVETIKKISKGKWEWEPEVGEWFVRFGIANPNPHLITYIERDFFRYAIDGGEGRCSRMDWKDCIPLLHWERIEEILERMGYFIRVSNWSVDGKRIYRHEFYADTWNLARSNREYIVSECASTAQEAVQKAVIELGKER